MKKRLLYIGGFAGTSTSTSGFRSVYDPTTPNGVRRLPFRRDIYSSLTPSILIWERGEAPKEDRYHVVDFGTGFPRVADFLRGVLDERQADGATAHCYLTHEHNDHTEAVHRGNGILLRPHTTLRFHSPDLSRFRRPGLPRPEKCATARMVDNYLGAGYWPAIHDLMEKLDVRCEHEEFQLGTAFTVGEASHATTVRTFALTHPEGCAGYRFEFPDGKVLVTAWDHEPGEDIDEQFVSHIDGVDVALFDLQYRDAEADGTQCLGFEKKPTVRRGWGHGTQNRLFPAIRACRRPPRTMIFGHIDLAWYGDFMKTLRLAVLLSGAGTTLQNLLDRSQAGEPYDIAVVVGSKPDAYGLTRAKNAHIPAVAVPRKDYETTDTYNEALWAEIRKHAVDVVVLAGFLHMVRVPEDFQHKIVNVHPALLPAFGGKGMYGIHVHEAVLAYGAKITGCTVHFVDEKYDTGAIILQKSVPVEENDTADTLQARVQEAEREALPEALRLLAGGRVTVHERRVSIRPSTDTR